MDPLANVQPTVAPQSTTTNDAAIEAQFNEAAGAVLAMITMPIIQQCLSMANE